MRKFILTDAEPPFNSDSDTVAKIVTSRLGLLPRKLGATDAMHLLLLELYERTKLATRDKNAELAVMTVEQMAAFAKITKQTMYEYLERWNDLEFIVRVSFFDAQKKKIVG